MLNQTDKEDTEQKVLEAAREVFQKKGFSGARMEDIANTAGVNKALLHYYFRSKEKLFDQVFREAIGQFVQKVIKILEGEFPLDVKIYKTVDMYSSLLQHNNHLPLFVLNEIRENPDLLISIIKGKEDFPLKNLAAQLEREYEKGNIIRIPVYEFFINLLSLTVFPFLVNPLLKGVFHLDDRTFQQMIERRRKIVPRMIIESLMP